MAKRTVYRDYRIGHRGEFASESTFNRSKAQGVDCHIHREQVKSGEFVSIDDLFDFDDLPDEELYEYEFHGTADTGKRK